MAENELLGGRYRLAALLGRGGTAVVWRARDELLDREVAVKLLDTRVADDPALVSRLREEARAAAKLHHRNVVTVFDVGEVSRDLGAPLPYVVMELASGRSLSEALRDGPLPWPEAVRVAAEVATALAAAHARGVVHRDVKPENVMLTDDGAKLVDFGISAAIGESDLSPEGQLLCTPAYLAPERLECGRVQAACDVYGLGLLLYKCVTGTLPWQCDGMTELVIARRDRPPAPLPPLPGLPPEVAALYRRCTVTDPEQRPSSAEAARILTASVPVADSTAAVGPAPAAQTLARTVTASLPPAAPPPARRPALALAASVVLLAALVLGLVVRVGDEPPAVAADETGCQIRYDLREDSGDGFVAGVTLTNTGVSPLAGWRLDFAFPADQQVSASSAADWRQTGSSVAVETGDTLAVGESLSFDLAGSYREANPLPTSFALNGRECRQTLTASPGGAEEAETALANASTQLSPSRPGPDGPARERAAAGDDAPEKKQDKEEKKEKGKDKDNPRKAKGNDRPGKGGAGG